MTNAKDRWDRENTTYFSLKLNNRTDAEIIAKLRAQPSIQGYIRELIRQDIKRETGE